MAQLGHSRELNRQNRYTGAADFEQQYRVTTILSAVILESRARRHLDLFGMYRNYEAGPRIPRDSHQSSSPRICR